MLWIHTHYPARGRKQQIRHLPLQVCPAIVIHTHYPARGRKPLSSLDRFKDLRDRDSYPLPRKGTETRLSIITEMNSSFEIHTHYPARGRKHSDADAGVAESDLGIHTHYPARGRKHPILKTSSGSCSSAKRFIPTTPQGDGNLDL